MMENFPFIVLIAEAMVVSVSLLKPAKFHPGLRVILWAISLPVLERVTPSAFVIYIQYAFPTSMVFNSPPLEEFLYFHCCVEGLKSPHTILKLSEISLRIFAVAVLPGCKGRDMRFHPFARDIRNTPSFEPACAIVNIWSARMMTPVRALASELTATE